MASLCLVCGNAWTGARTKPCSCGSAEFERISSRAARAIWALYRAGVDVGYHRGRAPHIDTERTAA